MNEAPVHILKFKGGPADQVFRLAKGLLPERVIFRVGTGEALEEHQYLYEGEEPQSRLSLRYDPRTKSATSEKIILGVYHIYRPGPAAEAPQTP